MVVMPQGHAFANFSERMIAEVKKILNSLREDTNASVYRQPQSVLELSGKLLLIENLMSLRPILCSSKSQEFQLLTPRQLTHPFLSPEMMNNSVIDTLNATFHPDEIVSQLGRSGHQAKQLLQDRLIQYLQESGIRYASEKRGNKQKPAIVQLKPLVGDVVFFVNSEKKKTFGIIIEILNENQVSIRTKYNGTVQLRSLHIRVLTLLFRPEEWIDDLPAK